MTSTIEFSANDPWRPANWRYQLAAERVASGCPFPQDWDGSTRAAASYLRRERRGDGSRHLAADFPDLYLALEIFRDADQELRWAIEARLLAGATATDIAGTTGLSLAGIDVFASVCFDVSDRLENREFIVGTIIGPDPSVPYDFRDRGWKVLAYSGGQEALAVALGPDAHCGIGEIIRADRRATALAAAVHIRQRAECGEESHLNLLRHLPKLVAGLEQTAEADGRLKSIEANVDQFYGGMSVEPRLQEYVENHPDYQRSPEMQAKVQELRELGLWGPGIGNVEQTTSTSPQDIDSDPFATATD
jgi:hypothetical protein